MKTVSSPPVKIDDVGIGKNASKQLEIKDAGVQTNKINANAVDGSSIEVSGGKLRVKAGGISDAMLASVFAKFADTRFKILSFTHDAADGSNQNVTGVGFTPKSVIFLVKLDNINNTKINIGLDDGTTHTIMYIDGAGAWQMDTGKSLLADDNGAQYIIGYISAFGADGFTITWTKTGFPTGTFNIQCFVFR